MEPTGPDDEMCVDLNRPSHTCRHGQNNIGLSTILPASQLVICQLTIYLFPFLTPFKVC